MRIRPTFAMAALLGGVLCCSFGMENTQSSSDGCGPVHTCTPLGDRPAHAHADKDSYGCAIWVCDFGWRSCSGTCSSHVEDDDANCGLCGNACSDSTCKLGSCAPVVALATGLSSSKNVAVGGDWIYFTEQGADYASTIRRMRRDGSAAEVLAQGVSLAGIAASERGVFWLEYTDGATALRGVLAGHGEASTIASSLARGAGSLVVDATTATWLSADVTPPSVSDGGADVDADADADAGRASTGMGGVWSVSLDGGPVWLVASLQRSPIGYLGASGLAQSGDVLAYVDGNETWAVRRSTGVTLRLDAAGTNDLILGIVADDASAYWAATGLCLSQQCASGAWHVRRGALDGSGIVDVTTRFIVPLAASWGQLYAVDDQHADVLVRIDAPSGSRFVLAGGLGEIDALAIDAASIYWTARGSGGDDGRLMTTAR